MIRNKYAVYVAVCTLMVMFFTGQADSDESKPLEVFTREGNLVVAGIGYEAEISQNGSIRLYAVQEGEKSIVCRISGLENNFIRPEGADEIRVSRGKTDVQMKERTDEKIIVSAVSHNEEASVGYAHKVEQEFTFYRGENYFDVSVNFTNLGAEMNFVRLRVGGVPSKETNRVYAVDASEGERDSGLFRLTDPPIRFHGTLDSANPVFGMASEGERWKVEFASLDNYPFFYFFRDEGNGSYFRLFFYYSTLVYRQAKGVEGAFTLAGGESVSYNIRITTTTLPR